MDVSFANAALAAVCNSEDRLVARWGPDVGRLVARRLLELAAADADAVDRLPRAQVRPDAHSGEKIIDFGGEVVVRGQILDGAPAASDTTERRSRLLITGLEARRSARS